MSTPRTGAAGWVAAVDLGATSGRVLLGHLGADELSVEVVHRFPNEPVRTAGGLGWNILELYRNVLEGLRAAVAARPELASIGIDSWAVDYALLRGDRMISSPVHYRDERTARGVRAVHAVVEQADLYTASGVAFLPFNTLYQLAVDHADGLLDERTTMLMVPDLFGFWLTGEKAAERTNASTTGLLDGTGGGWNTSLIDELGLPRSLFPPLLDAGSRLGSLRGSVAAELGTERRIDVVAVGSHDTASAVLATPMQSRRAAYISSGTWSLVGVELDDPVVSEAGRAANFTNEGGVDGRVRYLHNVMGLWLLSESVRGWERDGASIDLPELLRAAARVRQPVTIFDANNPSLLPAGDMPGRIAALCARQGSVPTTPPEFARSILESLAAAYAVAIDQAQELSGTTIEVVHVVGGGSQNALLCQLTADRTGRPVLAGPVEATAIGNVLVQARAAGLVSGDPEQLRGLVARFFPPTRFDPDPSGGADGGR